MTQDIPNNSEDGYYPRQEKYNMSFNGSWDVYDYDTYEYDYESSITLESLFVPSLVIPLLVYSFTFLLGILGNCLILVAVARQRQVRQSPTNVFLASLATADILLIAVCLPLKMAKLFSYTWTFGEVCCKAVHYIEIVSAVCSVLNLTALSVERYYAVVHPMKAQYLCTTSQAKRVTVLVWISSFILAIPTIISRVHMEVGKNFNGKFKAYWCVPALDTHWLFRLHEIYLLFIILIIPGMVMGMSYALIICELNTLVRERVKLTNTDLTIRQTTWTTFDKSNNITDVTTSLSCNASRKNSTNGSGTIYNDRNNSGAIYERKNSGTNYEKNKAIAIYEKKNSGAIYERKNSGTFPSRQCRLSKLGEEEEELSAIQQNPMEPQQLLNRKGSIRSQNKTSTEELEQLCHLENFIGEHGEKEENTRDKGRKKKVKKEISRWGNSMADKNNRRLLVPKCSSTSLSSSPSSRNLLATKPGALFLGGSTTSLQSEVKRRRLCTKDEETKQVIRMLIFIMILFFICWAPLLIFNVMGAFGVFHMEIQGSAKHIKTVFSLMSYINSCMNPIVYGFMSKNFRDSFISSLTLLRCRGSSLPR